MRALLAVLTLLILAPMLAACDAPAPQSLRLVTLDPGSSAGLSLRELPAAALAPLGLSYGLAVVDAGAIGERAGLRIGDVIYGVNQKRVQSLEEFTRLVASRGDGRIGLLVRRGDSDFWVAMELGGAPRPYDKGGVGPRAPAKDTLLRT